MESLQMKKLQQVLPLVLCQVLTFHQNPHLNIFLESKSASKLLVPSVSLDFLHSTDSTFPSSKSSPLFLSLHLEVSISGCDEIRCVLASCLRKSACVLKNAATKPSNFGKLDTEHICLCHLSFPGQVDQNIAVQALEAGNESVYCGIQKLNCLSQVSQGCHLHSAT